MNHVIVTVNIGMSALSVVQQQSNTIVAIKVKRKVDPYSGDFRNRACDLLCEVCFSCVFCVCTCSK